MVVVVAASAVVVSTAASFAPSGTDQAADGLEVEPADGPNGDYGVLNADDESNSC